MIETLTWQSVVDTGPILTTVSFEPYPNRPEEWKHDSSSLLLPMI